MKKELTIILGPTGVGKTDYAIALAKAYGSPVINCDSRQIFREMQIGTAPPSPGQLREVKHYFIFSHSVREYYTAGRYELEALALLEELFEKHDRLIMAGGSGMYIDALCNGLDDFPEADQQLRSSLMRRLKQEGLESLRQQLEAVDKVSYDTIDISNPQRVVRALEVTLQTGRKFSDWKSSPRKERPFLIRKTGLNRERRELYERINHRVDLMMEAGLLDEVRALQEYRDRPALKTVGYKELFDYLDGLTDLETAVDLIKRNSRRYAKRQLTYWGRDRDIEWLNV